MPAMPLILTEDDVKAVLTMDDLITTMERALAEFSAGRVVQPLRTVLLVGADKAYFGVMPAYIPSLPAVGTKMVTVFASNAQRGLPSHLANITLLDPETGGTIAVMDGRFITEARTAAVSAVSVKHLARQDASVLALLGSGVQARSHLEAIARVRPLEEVRVWSRTAERRNAFVRETEPHTGARIIASNSAQEAADGADIIVLVTASREPVLQSEWVADGTHICAIGACRPDQREMAAALVARSTLYVDSREGALAEAGDIVLAIMDGAIGSNHIAGELGELVTGNVRNLARGGVTIFKSLGMAVEDVAAAHLALTKARQAGRGREITM
jgi:alanine dehydrogenase